ncbi:MAG: hypothetical protein IJP90_12485, partial [Treponema sp.]|nr:hypothetical protein [Treponema sp.]
VGCEMTLNDEDSRKEVVEAKAEANADKGSGNGNGGGSTGTVDGTYASYGTLVAGSWNTADGTIGALNGISATTGLTVSFHIDNAMTSTDQVVLFTNSDATCGITNGYLWPWASANTKNIGVNDAWLGSSYGVIKEACVANSLYTVVFGTDGGVYFYVNGEMIGNGWCESVVTDSDAWAGVKNFNKTMVNAAAGGLKVLHDMASLNLTMDDFLYTKAMSKDEVKAMYDAWKKGKSPAPTTDNSSQAENSGNNNSDNNGNNDSGNNGNNNSGNTENGQNGGTEKTVASIAITNASLKYDFYNPAAYTEIINSTSLTKAIDFTVTATYSDNTTGSLAASSCTFAVTGTNVTATYNSLTSPAYALPAPTYIISEATTVTDSNAMKSSSDAVLAKGKTSAALFTAKNADDNTYNVWVEIWGNSGVTMRMDNWAWNYGWNGAEAGSGLTIGATDGGDDDKKSIVASESDWVTALKTKLTSGYKVLAVIENGNSDVNVTLTSPEWAGWKQTYKLSKASDTANGEVRFHFNTGAANSSIAFQ